MRIKLLYTLIIALVLLGSTSLTQAQRKRPAPPSPARQMELLLPKVEKKIENLNAEVGRVASRGTVSATTTDSLSESLSKLDEDIASLRGSLESGYQVNDEVRAALVSATRVDQFMAKNPISASASTQWRGLKRDMVSLATYNRISWNWRQFVPSLPGNTTTGVVVPNPTPVPTPYPTPYATPYPTPTPYSSGSLYTATDSQMSTLLSRIDLKTGIFRSQLQAALNSDTAAGRDDSVLTYLSRFETATTRLRQQFGRRDATLLDVTDVLTAATYVDQFMARSRTTSEASGQWRDLKNDLNTLSTYYRQSWNWNQDLPTGPFAGGTDLRGFASRITGTYRLNTSASEDTAPAINRALGSVNNADRENTRLSLERRLRSPEMLAIEMNNRTVSMASSLLPKVTFQADGTARSETNERGRTVTTTATVDEDGLIVTYLGQRSNDFYLTIVPTTGGRLRVTRRVFLDESSEGISVTSVYDKIDNVARFTGLGRPAAGDPTVAPVADGTAVVPFGTRLNAELRTAISGSPATDRVSMEVTSFGQFRRAIISGRVLLEDPRTRIAGRTRALIALDTITLPSGVTYAFAGDILSVTSATGEVIEVSNQTATTPTAQPQRGVGGILGALIGAISGVPVDQGTAASQAGAIISQRGDTLYLGVGSQLVISATTPRP